ncbi:MAG: hypothetical protein K5681_00740 [Treponema sp.]|nr:hypothetical protein [Treponema sp.]
MKKIFFTVLVVGLFIFAGCASTPSEGVQKEKNLNQKKLRYDDWKYMGFGREIPEWVELAINNNPSKIKKLIPELAEAEIEVRSAAGINIDQAEESLLELGIPEGFSVYDSFWVRQGKSVEKPYIAVAIYRRLL